HGRDARATIARRRFMVPMHAKKRKERADKSAEANHRIEAGAEESAILAGVTWLLDLQNSDGGIPTFCRGWSNLPFDRSAPDLTAHVLRAWSSWLPDLPADLQARVRTAMRKALHYLDRTQRPEGAWIPLWFGNQHAPDETNAVYGTARVLIALVEMAGQAGCLPISGVPPAEKIRLTAMVQNADFLGAGKVHGFISSLIENGAHWFLSAQKDNGSWGAAAEGPPSVEETALAV